MVTNMNLSVLNYVVTVAQERSFTRAAKKLYIAQPSLSQSIKTLEEQLGVQLFDRNRNPVDLTPAGEIYIEWAKIMLRTEEKMLSKMHALSGNKRRRITVGASPNHFKNVLPGAISDFYKQAENCTMVLVEKPYNELLSMLDNGDLDMLIGMPQSDTFQYTSIPIAEEKILVAADEHISFNTVTEGDYMSISFSEIVDKPFIMIDEMIYIGTIIRSIFSKFNEVPNTVMVCPCAETANIMVGAGIGISIIPELYKNYTPCSSNVRYYLINDLKLSINIAVVYRNDRYFPDDCRIFLEILKKEYGKSLIS